MLQNETNSLKLAKELDVKPSIIVAEIAKIRNVEFKKHVTNIKLTQEEVQKIRQLLTSDKMPPLQESTETIPEQKSLSDKIEKQEDITPSIKAPTQPSPEITITKEDKTDIVVSIEEKGEFQIDDTADTLEQDQSHIVTEDIEEVILPSKFQKEIIDVTKVEKIKPSMQKAFHAIKKIEPKKWVDNKTHKKSKDKFFKKTETIQQTQITAPRKKSIKMQEGTTVKEFAELLGIKISDVIKKFMELGYMATINQPIDMDAAVIVAESFGMKIDTVAAEHIDIIEEEADQESNLISRPPVVTIMGHVDHGKTS
ncbi:MAG: translation initiation factor IF-2 N-terminal domain-containing protein, partial [Thermodesulfovibrionales bacterium]|nr:translation initiation factor IF-2 N-terminal domain-containing protein [Thermodesulfovibrionales bacterium]